MLDVNFIAASNETLLRQAPNTAAEYMYAAVREITSAGIAEWSSTWDIMQADGSVASANGTWNDYDEWLTQQKEDEQKRNDGGVS
jgi:hypothetical protein